jgi:hypothetical protein
MPININYSPVGLLTNLAQRAGQADTPAPRVIFRPEQRENAGDGQSFALQRALAAQLAKARDEPDEISQRQRARRIVGLAEESNVYRPEQLQQLRIFAEMGDEQSMRQVLGDVQGPSVGEREQARQVAALDQISAQRLGEIQNQLGSLDEQLLNPHGAEDAVKLLHQRSALLQLREQTAQTSQEQKEALQMGVSLPRQAAAQQTQERGQQRQEFSQQRFALQTLIREKQTEMNALTRQLTGSNSILLSDEERSQIQQKINGLHADIDHAVGGEQEQPVGSQPTAGVIRKATDSEKARAVIQANGDVDKARQILHQNGLTD